MQKKWFKNYGWIYLPISWQGWIATLLTLAFCLQIFLAVDSHSHSVSDTFYGVFPYIVLSLGIWYWLASKTSKK